MIRDFFNYLQGEMTFLEVLISLCAVLFVLFCTLPIHEFAHAKVATWLGDQTPRLSGRLTLNPFRHLDPIGSLMILLVGFGYAKPVQVNMRNFKNPRGGMALTAIAGPLSNIIAAFFFMLIYNILLFFYVSSQSPVIASIMMFLSFAAIINISLGVFNLLPIPPLDGSRILTLLIPARHYYKVMQYERYIMIGVLVLIFTGVLSTPLTRLSGLVFTGINRVASLIVNLFL
ncbi:MAG: putative zinc metalloprotease [Firmicutes bacterium ADurb.Bin300]|jgi:Zn-dependent protease|nr:MAG: putative zinc metalloprotease [Firmicutes bacterium ADurb.Bin300]HOD03011.1 site-2 protease family protein [Clostridiales bacterium]